MCCIASEPNNSYASGKPTPAGQGTVDKILTPANVVTMIRICLVPVFVVALISPWPDWIGFESLDPWKAWIAAIIFVAISCTDWLDGYLARSRGEVTDFGKFMDPLADKVLVVAALLVLVELGSLPSWPVIIIIAREFIVSGVRMVAASKGEVIAASWYGKFKTVFQMIAIVLFVVKESPAVLGLLTPQLAFGLYLLSWLVMAIALVLTIVSMMDYIWKARHLIGFKPKGGQARVVDNATLAKQCGVDDFSNEIRIEAARAVVEKARAAGKTVGTAESCTGGIVGRGARRHRELCERREKSAARRSRCRVRRRKRRVRVGGGCHGPGRAASFGCGCGVLGHGNRRPWRRRARQARRHGMGGCRLYRRGVCQGMPFRGRSRFGKGSGGSNGS